MGYLNKAETCIIRSDRAERGLGFFQNNHHCTTICKLLDLTPLIQLSNKSNEVDNEPLDDTNSGENAEGEEYAIPSEYS